MIARFVADSPLEGEGFEPSVPPLEADLFLAAEIGAAEGVAAVAAYGLERMGWDRCLGKRRHRLALTRTSSARTERAALKSRGAGLHAESLNRHGPIASLCEHRVLNDARGKRKSGSSGD